MRLFMPALLVCAVFFFETACPIAAVQDVQSASAQAPKKPEIALLAGDGEQGVSAFSLINSRNAALRHLLATAANATAVNATLADCTCAAANATAPKIKKKKKKKPMYKQHSTHGYLTGISFGIAMPFAAIIIRNFKSSKSWWFHTHWMLGLAAWVVGTIGTAFGQWLNDLGEEVMTVHAALGWLVVALVTVQMTAILIRPTVNNGWRWAWNVLHHWTGRAGIAFGIANTYIGFHESHREGRIYWYYTIVLFGIMLLWFTKELTDALITGFYRPPAGVAKAETEQDWDASKIALEQEEAGSAAPKSRAGLLNPRCLNEPYVA